MSFNISINRSTNEERIYINAGQSAEVWIEQCETDPSTRLGRDYKINTAARDVMDLDCTNFKIDPCVREYGYETAVIDDLTHMLFVQTLGLNPDKFMSSDLTVRELAPNFETIKAMATED
tara:strand:+ start:256 stop:615 length:360 start_codon:yes stop_codon:yes gene_type:complete